MKLCRTSPRVPCLLLFLIGSLAIPRLACAALLFDTDTTWKILKGRSEASIPSTQWRLANFDDSNWVLAPAPIYYSNTATEPPFRTSVSFSGTMLEDMRNSYSCVFLRKSFVIESPSAAGAITLRAAADDGFIAWINGVEIARVNVPPGEPAFDDSAAGTMAEPAELQTFRLEASASVLLVGTNVLAVQAFNATLASTDFGFLADLASEGDATPPQVLQVVPAPGVVVTALTAIDVLFDEPVGGVNGNDLLVNGAPATDMTELEPNRYQFRFPQPVPGSVQINWSALHGITNFSGLNFAGGSWGYVLDPNRPPPPVIINEILAANANTLADEDGDFSDWIELFNPDSLPVDLSNWFLTDDPSHFQKWMFPPTTLPAGGYLLVFASGKDRRQAGSPLHTNFRLDAAGEFLSLIRPDGLTQASTFTPGFPALPPGISFGTLGSGGTNALLTPPTPGGPNATTVARFVADTKFSRDRGFSGTNFDLVITCATPGAHIYFTTNGSPPSAANGTLYAGPIPIDRTTVLRARAELEGYLPSNVDTHTYLFLKDILRQSPTGIAPPGWPSSWGDNVVDYGMDPDIVDQLPWSATISNDLRSLPSLSLVMRLEDLFDPQTGIYANAFDQGREWERPGSIELIHPDGRKGFQADAGVRIRGGFSRSPDNPKHSLRLLFRDEYGASKLNYPLFGPSGPQSIDAFDLRTSQDGSWAFQGDPSGLFLNDSFSRDSQLAMGQAGERGDWYHLYLNGQYWGLYNSCERPEASFAATHFGGDAEDYDILKPDPDLDHDIKPTEGNDAAWIRLWQAATNGFSSNAAYFRSQGRNPDASLNPAYENLIDVTNLVDYMLVVFWTGNWDGPIFSSLTSGFPNNFFAIRSRQNIAGFRFIAHDAELSLQNPFEDRIGTTTIGDPAAGDGPERSNPYYLWNRLLQNAEFRQLVADRIQRHFFGSGSLTTEAATARFIRRRDEIDRGMVGESARWGDAKRPSDPIVREDWVQTVSQEITSYFPDRHSVVLQQLRNHGLFPTLSAPTLSQVGGEVALGTTIILGNPNSAGTIFLTVNGPDPRAVGGTIAPSAVAYDTPIAVNGSLRIRARIKDGASWSPLIEETWYPLQDFSGLRITEIMYHPAPDTLLDSDEFEFLELQNTGAGLLDLGGLAFQGITIAFAPGTHLDPGGFLVLARNPDAFALRHPGVAIQGIYTGKLDNNGETLSLVTPTGTQVLKVDYGDRAPWPVAPDGHGFSLVPLVPGATSDPDLGSNWRASSLPNGSPGQPDPSAAIPRVRINEILSHTDPPQSDSIELINPTAAPADVSGWFLTDDPSVPRKFRIAAGTIIVPGGFLVLNEADFNPGGLGFALSSGGDAIYLFSGAANGTNLTGYTHGTEFGASANGVSFGRLVLSTGAEDFAAQIQTSLGLPNAGPAIGPIVLSEIHYHPIPGSDEFVELLNISSNPVNLRDPDHPTNAWFLNGLGFTFPTTASIPARGLALVVGIDPASFRTKYSVPASVPIFGPFTGSPQDSGERLALQRPDTPNVDGSIPYIDVDVVRYNDRAPWPPGADGTGPSLQRLDPGSYGNDSVNWTAGDPSPGTANLSNLPPTVRFLTPADQTSFTIPGILPLEVEAIDPDGSITRVEFFDGITKIGEAASPPYRIDWVSPTPGTHTLTARAHDNQLASGASAPVTVIVTALPSGQGIGLRGQYFNTPDFRGTPAARVDPLIDFTWPAAPHPEIGADGFSVRWTGLIQPKVSGVQSLYLVSAGGARLLLNGITLIDNWTDHAQTEDSANAALVAGERYPLEIYYYNLSGLGRVELAWAASSLPREVIPASQLYPPLNPANQPPHVAILDPTDQNGVPVGPITVRLSASDPDGALLKVELRVDGLPVAERSAPPFDLLWPNATIGTHQLTATATDDNSATTSTLPLTVHVVNSVSTPETWVGFGSIWRYWDQGPLPGVPWASLGFADSDWPSGEGELGYGDGDESTPIGFGPDPNQKFITTLFRHPFTVNDPGAISALHLRLIRDDGAAVYLNGIEVFRDNLPPGPPSPETLATLSLGLPEEAQPIAATLNPASLRAGLNVLAVEMHQFEGNSSDLSFDAELTGTRSVLAPFFRTQPASLSVTTGTTVWFSADVGGSPPLSFQWLRDGTPIIGQTSPTLQLLNVQPDQAGAYRLTVSNSAGALTSEAAILSVAGGPQPPRLTIFSAANGIEIQFVRESGLQYAIQSSPVLPAQAWTTITNLPAVDQATEFRLQLTALNPPGEFFRVTATPVTP